MKFAGVQEIKKELQLLPPKKLQELCLRLAKYKKENKELLAFLLFEADEKQPFIDELKSEFRQQFSELSAQTNLFYVKKGLRRLLRLLNRYIKYIDDKSLAIDLLMFFCRSLDEYQIPVKKSQQLRNLYDQQLKKINVLITGLHEDVRQDYYEELKELQQI